MTSHTTGRHVGLITHSRGKTSVICKCNGFYAKPLRYVDPDAVFASHTQEAARRDLQEHFNARRGQ